MNLIVKVKYDKEANVFVSHCPSLDIYSQGRTEDEAFVAGWNAVSLYLSAHYERGTLESTLKEAGLSK